MSCINIYTFMKNDNYKKNDENFKELLLSQELYRFKCWLNIINFAFVFICQVGRAV